MILRSILSPVDFSEHSSDALRWADAAILKGAKLLCQWVGRRT
jgi:hypothetical protein